MNLWANTDNNQQLSTPNGNGGREGARRPTEGNVLSALREWLLQDYAASYCRSLAATRIYRRCYWLDGLGALNRVNVQHEVALEPDVAINVQKEKKQRKNGADLVVPVALKPIATLSRQLASEQPPIVLHGLMFAAGSSKKNMRKEGASRPEKTGKGEPSAKSMAIPSSSSIMATSWLEAAPVLLKEIEQVPAIFLLNPFGQTMFSHEELSLLYQRTAPTELCFLIVHKQMHACLRTAQHREQQARVLTALLRTDRWKTLPEGEEGAQQAINECIGMFLSSMKRHFTFPIQSIALPMQTRPAFVEEMPYTLIFATRRQDSLFSMNDAICEYRRRINEQSHYGVLGEEWFAAQWQERIKATQRALYQYILQRGSAQRTRRWPDLRQQALLGHFGQFKACDYDDIIGQLLANGEVRYEAQRTSIEGESLPLPAHDDILVWNK
jgi:hypothetical protein